jgi:creatinine amidohydrolase
MPRLDLMTWDEVQAHLADGGGVILPVGSTEQHGPMGLIGTDALCAEAIAEAAADRCGAVVAPTVWFTPAPFNMGFPGTLSASTPLFSALVAEILDGLAHHGFRPIYILNGHGANLAPLRAVAAARADRPIHIRSWWDFEAVNTLRRALYGDWEGMHATPSEIAITMATHRQVPVPEAARQPPRALSADFIRDHAGDRHGPPDEHRRDFPDGRVGSHSALAQPEHGRALLDAAAAAVAQDYLDLAAAGRPAASRS